MTGKTIIDIIILSYANTPKLRTITETCLNSLVESEDPSAIVFNTIVIESEKKLNNYQYPFTKTVYPDEQFGYHRYMNIGLNISSSPFVCLCNNDLIFHTNWASEILHYMEEMPDLMSASPICSLLQPHTQIALNNGVRLGYRVGYEISGWCLFMKRDLFKITGKLDENYIFSGADHDYANTLAALNLKHGLITSSIVDHLYNTTLVTQSVDRQDELKSGGAYHSLKWGYRMLPFDI